MTRRTVADAGAAWAAADGSAEADATVAGAVSSVRTGVAEAEVAKWGITFFTIATAVSATFLRTGTDGAAAGAVAVVAEAEAATLAALPGDSELLMVWAVLVVAAVAVMATAVTGLCVALLAVVVVVVAAVVAVVTAATLVTWSAARNVRPGPCVKRCRYCQ